MCSLQVLHQMSERPVPNWRSTQSAGDVPQRITNRATRFSAGSETQPRIDQLFSDYRKSSKPDSHRPQNAGVCITFACVNTWGLVIKMHLAAPGKERENQGLYLPEKTLPDSLVVASALFSPPQLLQRNGKIKQNLCEEAACILCLPPLPGTYGRLCSIKLPIVFDIRL